MTDCAFTPEADFNGKDRIGVNICISGKVLDIDGTIVGSSRAVRPE